MDGEKTQWGEEERTEAGPEEDFGDHFECSKLVICRGVGKIRHSPYSIAAGYMTVARSRLFSSLIVVVLKFEAHSLGTVNKFVTCSSSIYFTTAFDDASPKDMT